MNSMELLCGYDVSKIELSDSESCYNVELRPRPKPIVRLKIRKKDIRILAFCIESSDGDWEIDTDHGKLRLKDNAYGLTIKNLISLEIEGEPLNFYGVRKD